MQAEQQSSLFRRLLLGFSGVILFVALCGFIYVAWEARETQRSRTASENSAHARELLMHLADVADKPGRVLEAATALDTWITSHQDCRAGTSGPTGVGKPMVAG